MAGSKRLEGTREVPRGKQRLISLLVLLVLAGAWEIASLLYHAKSQLSNVYLVPGWEVLVRSGFKGLSEFWGGGFGVESTLTGGKETYQGAFLALASQSADTAVRLLGGLALGAFLGTGSGLAVSWSPWGRRVVALPGHILRTMPLLAMIPLFQLWFGISETGVVIFVAYGTGVLFFVGTVNAVNNVGQIYLQNARVLGASHGRIYRTVILPSIFPELRSTIMLALGISWAAVIGAEFLGTQTGLGYIIVQSEQFSLVDRMTVVTLIVLFYASISYFVFDRVSRRLLAWMPQTDRLQGDV